MLNPAWRPAQDDNASLATLKQDYQPTAPAEGTCQEPSRPLYIIKAWTQAGHSSDIDYLTNALERQLNLPASSRDEPGGRWSLQSADTAPMDHLQDDPFILLLIEAHLDALKMAYTRLKRLHSLRHATFGVVVQGARDDETARRYYRRFAIGSLRFLDLPLLFCGAAPARGDGFSRRIALLGQQVCQHALQQPHLRDTERPL